MQDSNFSIDYKLLFIGIAILIVFGLFSGNILNASTEARESRNSEPATSSGDEITAEPAATPNTRQTTQCRDLLRGNSRNRFNEMGDLPADMPVPRDSVLCGYDDGQRATYFINPTLTPAVIAQFYRDALPPQGFNLLLDNPSNGGRFMNFVRGTSENIMVQTVLSEGAEFRNVFSVAYMPPRDERGEVILGTTIMRGGGNANINANVRTPTPANAPSRNARNDVAAVCGRNALGSEACAVALQFKSKYWKFSVLNTDPNGRRQTFDGERSFNSDKKLIIHVNIGGAGRENDGEWWYRFGNSPLDSAADRGERSYLKEGGAWHEMRQPPPAMGELITNSVAITKADLSLTNPVQSTETINGQLCNRFRRTYEDWTLTLWISQSTGYAVRKVFAQRGYIIQTDNSNQSITDTIIQSPAGER